MCLFSSENIKKIGRILMRITPEKSAPTPARILARNQMAETAEEAEMRELEEEDIA